MARPCGGALPCGGRPGPAERWREALAHLEELGIPNGDRGAAKVRRPGEGGTYMDDPAGYVVQYITDGME